MEEYFADVEPPTSTDARLRSSQEAIKGPHRPLDTGTHTATAIEGVEVPPKRKLLIFVIAYYAESTLQAVLERISSDIFSRYHCEILIVDDASMDRTHEIGLEYRRDHPEKVVTVLKNAYNQGYGGNQKVGYHYAITNGFDYVAMIHGDGQYAPEELGRLLEPLDAGVADAVFGSRMMEKGAARRGGMPLYKFLGNRVLTLIQNRLLGSSLSEFHSGYRVYSTAALRRIHFRLNSSEFHFDTEIIIQLMNADQRIVELSIPTYYGDEISRVNGIPYAFKVLKATLENVVHRAGILQQRRLDPIRDSAQHYGLKLDFPSSHEAALKRVPPSASVLDLGAGPGGIAAVLATRGNPTTAVDIFAPCEPTPGVSVIVQDLNEEFFLFDASEFDIILGLDILEHLHNPEEFLGRLRSQFDYEGKRAIFTTPNVGFFLQRLALAFGQFNYGSAGILDRTHTRLFTFRTFRHLLRDAGFQIDELIGIPAPWQKALGDNVVGRLATRINIGLIGVWKTAFSYQILASCTSTPDLDYIVGDSFARSRDGSIDPESELAE